MVRRQLICFALIFVPLILARKKPTAPTTTTEEPTTTTEEYVSQCAEKNYNCVTGYCPKSQQIEKGCNCKKCTCPSACQEGKLCDKVADSCNQCKNSTACPSDNFDCAMSGGNKRCTCKRGFSGPGCYAGDNRCASYPCLHGGTCSGDRNEFSCKCPPGFSGKQCQVSGDPCDGVTCANGVNCTTVLDGSRGVCVCPRAWQGEKCEQSNLLTTRNCDNDCDGKCFKRPASLDNSTFFTAHNNKKMTAEMCKGIMMGIPTAEFYILAGPVCYTGDSAAMLTQQSKDKGCNTECPGSTKNSKSKCGDDKNILLVMYPFEQEEKQCTSGSCGSEKTGYCVEKKKGFSCVCSPGAKGKKCETAHEPCKDFDCQNGGTCKETDDKSAARCLCKEGYSGAKCEDEDPCRSVTCKNGGTCVHSNSTTAGYNCTCYPSYDGDTCEHFKACSLNPCGHGSVCVESGNAYECQCGKGWKGDDCDEDVDECDVAKDKNPPEQLCANGGTCNNTIGSYGCLCLEGTSGFDCSIKPDYCNMSYVGPDNRTYPNLCTYMDKNAVCLDGNTKYTCKCSAGSRGEHCMEDVNECTESSKPVCENFGTCVNTPGSYHCQCLFGTFGSDCSINPDDCEVSNVTVDGVLYGNECIARDKNASCTDGFGHYNCTCSPQWTGEHCMTDVNECASVPPPCVNFGTCVNTPGDYECVCINGTFGKNCEINPDDCENVTICNAMDSKANCTDGFASFSCNCGPDYTMQYCDLEVAIYKVLHLIGGGASNEVDLISMLRDLLRNPSMMKDLVPFVIGLQSMENRTKLSWNVEDMFLWITYEEKTLNMSQDLVAWNDVVLGNCFTFNHFNNTQRWYRKRSDGAMGGLKAALKLNSAEYVPWVDVTAIMTFIHPNKDTIFSESPRYNAAPSAMTTIQTTESQYQRLGGRYGRCIKSSNEVASYYYDGAYTTEGCLRSCYQDEVKRSCNCMDSRYPMPGNEAACELANRKCVDSITAKGDVATWAHCVCPLPCENSQFDSSYTVAPFRNKCNTYAPSQRVNRSECNDLNGQADYVIVNVQVPRMRITIFQETPSWTIDRIIGNIGGLSGVVCGINLISFFEFAFFFFYQMPMGLIFNRWNM